MKHAKGIITTIFGLTILAMTITRVTGVLAVILDPYPFLIYLPVVIKQEPPTPTPIPTPTPTNIPSPTPTVGPADLRLTALSGSTTPEFVTIQNLSGIAQNMTSWTLVSVVGPQTFNFPNGFTLGPGATVRVESYTGAVNNPPNILLWTNTAIWLNTGDKAELKNQFGIVVSTLCYGNACP